MTAKYPEAYGTCYQVDGRVVGVRALCYTGFANLWFVGYVDGLTKRNRAYPIDKDTNRVHDDPGRVQAKLDQFAKERGWMVAV